MLMALGACACTGNPFSTKDNSTSSADSQSVSSSTTTPPPKQLELVRAISRGIVTVYSEGNGIDSVKFKIMSSAKEPLQIQISAGTLLDSTSAGIQTMVLRRTVVLSLAPGEESDVELEAACANMTLEAPGSGDTFTIIEVFISWVEIYGRG
jgi:hypothetical protein